MCPKTHYMVFHRARSKIDHEDIILSNNILQQAHYTKFLGIIIDDKLKWANHISYIKNKIAKGMGILIKGQKGVKNTSVTAVIPFFRFSISYLLFRSMGYCF